MLVSNVPETGGALVMSFLQGLSLLFASGYPTIRASGNGSAAQELPGESTRDGGGMSRQNGDLSQ
jgi:hypothetical protein